MEENTNGAQPAARAKGKALGACCAAQAALCTKAGGRLKRLAVAQDGVTTAEYVVVLLAAVGFASVLMGILKSDAMRETLTNIINNALSVV